MYTQRAREVFDEWAPDYDAEVGNETHYVAHIKVAEALQDHGAKMDVRRIIDLGTGTGLLIPLLKAQFAKAAVTGVDLSEKMLEECRKKELDSDLMAFDLAQEEWPLEKESAQIVTASGVLEFIRDDGLFLKNAAKILEPDGLAIMTFEIRMPMPKGIMSSTPYFPRKAGEMAGHFIAAGFQIAEQSEFSAYKLMGRIPINYGLIAARKCDCV